MNNIKVGDIFMHSDHSFFIEVWSISEPDGRVRTSHGDYSFFILDTFYEKFKGHYGLFKLFQGVE